MPKINDKTNNKSMSKEIILISAFLLLVVIYYLYWINQKGNFFVDEYLSMQYAANYRVGGTIGFNESIDGWHKDKWITTNVLQDTIVVNDEKTIQTLPLPKLLYTLLRGRFFFGLLNMLVTNSSDQMQMGLYLNIAIATVALVLFYILMKKLTNSVFISAVALLFIGCCPGTVTLVTFVRFYLWEQLLLITVLNIMFKMMQSEDYKMNLLLELVCMFIAYVAYSNSELFIPMFLLLQAMYVVVLILRKKYKEAVYLLGLVISLGSIFLILKTKFIAILFKPDSLTGKAADVAGNIRNFEIGFIKKGIKSILLFQEEYTFGKRGNVFLIFAIILFLMVNYLVYLRKKRNKIEDSKTENINKSFVYIVVLIPAFLYGCFCVICGFFDAYRRSAYITVLIIIVVFYVISYLFQYLSSRLSRILVVILLLCSAIYIPTNLINNPRVDYLFKESKDVLTKISNYDYEGSLFYHNDEVLTGGEVFDCVMNSRSNVLFYYSTEDVRIEYNVAPNTMLIWTEAQNERLDLADLDDAGYVVEYIGSTSYCNVYYAQRQSFAARSVNL